MSYRGGWLRRCAGFLRKRTRELNFDVISDPRRHQGKRWQMKTVVRAVLLGLMDGRKSLAQLERLTEQMSPHSRAWLGIQRRLPDTTARSLICRLEPMDLLGLLTQTVKVAMRRKSVRLEKLPFGVVAMDGKATAIRDYDQEYSQQHHHEKTGHVYGLVRTVTACLVNALGQPCLGAYPVPAKTNEMGAFTKAFDWFVQAYGDLATVFSYDAGAASEHNANHVITNNKHYLFQLTDGNRLALKLSRQLLGPKQNALAQTADVLSNKREVVRKLFLHKIMDWKENETKTGRHFWSHTRTVIRVSSETFEDGKSQGEESRYFVCSLRVDKLDHAQWLQLIRLHWAVENCCHNTWDRFFAEDDHPWIEGDARGTLNMMILRRIAYTLLSLFRSVSLKSEESRSTEWRVLMEWMHTTLVGLAPAHTAGIRKTESLATL